MDSPAVQPKLLNAGPREAGAACPHCGVEIARDEAVAQCPACATVHHPLCWEAGGGCGSYACAPARRTVAAAQPASMKITSDELDRAVPLPPPRPSFSTMAIAPPMSPVLAIGLRPGTTSRLAIAALICAILGIPLFGVLTGAVAIILAALAIGAIQRTRMRGLWLAIVGLALGFVDVAGWLIFIVSWQGHHVALHRQQADIDLDPAALSAIDPAIADAMRANVVISCRAGMGERMGSGIILKIAGGVANIATNRHVIDASFADVGPNSEKPDTGAMTVRMIGQPPASGRVVWVAPRGVDLAIIAVDCHSHDVRAAKYPPAHPPKLGDGVFAIGNPQALGWSFSPGSISQFRTWETGETTVPVIQTSAPINSGNSGGGLYDKEGYLIGINTWTEDKRYSEALGFAISSKSLFESAPVQITGFDGLPRGAP